MIDVPTQIKNDYGKIIAKRVISIHNHNFYMIQDSYLTGRWVLEEQSIYQKW